MGQATWFEAVERRLVRKFLEARFSFSIHQTEANRAVFHAREDDLGEWVGEFGAVVCPAARYAREWDRTERRWRVREERAEFHGQRQWRAA